MSDTRPLGPHFKIAVTRPLAQGPTPPGATDPSEITEILILKTHPRQRDPITLQLEEGVPTSELAPATAPQPSPVGLTTPPGTGLLAGLWRRFRAKRAMPGSR